MPHNPSSQELISKFRKETESLGGQCHVAADEAAAVKIILDVATAGNCKLAAIENLPISSEKLQSALIHHGIRTVFFDDQSSTLQALAEADIGITHADVAVSQTGTILLKTTDDKARLVSCLPRIHVAIVHSSTLVRNLTDATEYVKSCLNATEPCTLSFISGPSRTSDIEMKHILGVHGPHQVHIILYGE